MGRILALDYGKKRVGMAVTDTLQITANGLDTVDTRDVKDFLIGYLEREEIDCVVVGEPKQLSNLPSESVRYIDPFITWFGKTFPEVKLDRMDERFTSKMAHRAIIDGGVKKIKRRNKELVDKVSAVIILQSYLEYVNRDSQGRL